MSNEKLDQMYEGTPGPTSYRAAAIFTIARISQDDAEQEKIRALAEKDNQFCLRLQEDLVFRDMCWYRMRFGHNWIAKSAKEEVARTTIDNAIADRIETRVGSKDAI